MKMQKKNKILPPTLREKKRYVVFAANYFGNKAPVYQRVKNAIAQGIHNFIGALSYGEAGVLFVKGTSKRGIMRVQRNYVDHIKTSLMTLQKIDQCAVAFRCIGVSGTLAQATTIYERQ